MSAKRRTFIRGPSRVAHFTFAPFARRLSPRIATCRRFTRCPAARSCAAAPRRSRHAVQPSLPRRSPARPRRRRRRLHDRRRRLRAARSGDLAAVARRGDAAGLARAAGLDVARADAAGAGRGAAGPARLAAGRRRGRRRRRRDARADGLLQSQQPHPRGQAPVPARAGAGRERLRPRRRRAAARRGAGREGAGAAGVRGHRAAPRRPGPAADDDRQQLRAARLSAPARQDANGRAAHRRAGREPALRCRSATPIASMR